MSGKLDMTDALIELVLDRRARHRPAGLVEAITAAVAEIPQVRRHWWTRAWTSPTSASTLRLSWILVLLGLLIAAAVGTALVGAGMLWRSDRQSVVVLPPSQMPAPSATLSARSLALGPVTWSRIQAPGSGIWWPLVGTPHGPLAAVEGAPGDVEHLRWLGPDGSWLRLPLPGGIFRMHAVGDSVIVDYGGDDSAYWLRWSGSGWEIGDRVYVEGRLNINDVATGPSGVLLNDGTAIAYSTDGLHFVRAVRPPDKAELQPNAAECGEWPGGFVGVGEGHMGPMIVTDRGFIVLTAADPADWVIDPICEPVLWASSDGSSWELVSPRSPFGTGASVTDIASRSGRHVAIGHAPAKEGGDGNAVWVSDDGFSWERLSMPEPAGPCPFVDPGLCGHVLSRIVAGEAGWIILDWEGSAWTSADGRTWDAAPSWPAIRAGYTPQGLALSPGSIVVTTYGVETGYGEIGVVGTFEP
jgi:hypothetical protein